MGIGAVHRRVRQPHQVGRHPDGPHGHGGQGDALGAGQARGKGRRLDQFEPRPCSRHHHGDRLDHRQPAVAGQGVDRDREAPRHHHRRLEPEKPEAARQLGMTTATRRHPIGHPWPLEHRHPFGVRHTRGPGRHAHQPPRSAQHHQGGHGDGQQGELQRFEGLEPSGLRGQGRHQCPHDHDGGQRRPRRARSALSLTDPSTTVIVERAVRPCPGPLGGGPAGHRFGRRWKKAQRHTTANVPSGMAKVRAWAPKGLLVPSITHRLSSGRNHPPRAASHTVSPRPMLRRRRVRSRRTGARRAPPPGR